jgi:peptidoglycan/LPS O-acetylase OafA/YrhL
MSSFIFLFMFVVPAAVLCWRLVVTKSRQQWLRIGAAAAAMATIAGAFVVYDEVADFDFKDWRSDVGLIAAMSGSAYLLAWAQRHRGNRRNRTISIIAAIIGLVPVIGAIATAMLFHE